jgi:hypothetical protein
MTDEALAKPHPGCVQERSQNTEDRSQDNRTRCPCNGSNSEFWLLNPALAEPTQEILQAPLMNDRGGLSPGFPTSPLLRIASAAS